MFKPLQCGIRKQIRQQSIFGGSPEFSVQFNVNFCTSSLLIRQNPHQIPCRLICYDLLCRGSPLSAMPLPCIPKSLAEPGRKRRLPASRIQMNSLLLLNLYPIFSYFHFQKDHTLSEAADKMRHPLSLFPHQRLFQLQTASASVLI